MLINRTWAGEAIFFLWNSPAAEALAALHVKRRHSYAAVRALSLDSAARAAGGPRSRQRVVSAAPHTLHIKTANVHCTALA
jgi:hypothetical protein